MLKDNDVTKNSLDGTQLVFPSWTVKGRDRVVGPKEDMLLFPHSPLPSWLNQSVSSLSSKESSNKRSQLVCLKQIKTKETNRLIERPCPWRRKGTNICLNINFTPVFPVPGSLFGYCFVVLVIPIETSSLAANQIA